LTPFNDHFKKSGIGDVAASVGWRAYVDNLEGILTLMGGFAQLGVLFPTAPARNENKVFAIPLGYNDKWGVIGHAAAETCLWNIVTLGIQAGAIMFFRDDRHLRMMTDPDKQQNGWIVLEKARASYDEGTLWDVGAYVKVDRLVRGFEAIVGYSFTQQEQTHLHVKDSWFLQNIINVNQDTSEWGQNYYIISRDNVANQNKRLREWNIQTLHFILGYDAMVHLKKTWGPFIRLEYDYPIYGKYSWQTDMFAGTLGLSVAWNF
jgi:hypothetical protein